MYAYASETTPYGVSRFLASTESFSCTVQDLVGWFTFQNTLGVYPFHMRPYHINLLASIVSITLISASALGLISALLIRSSFDIPQLRLQ